MPLVDMHDLLNHAYRNGYAVGAFELAGPEFLEAILEASERARSPVILTLVETDSGQRDFELAMAAAERAAQRAAVPVAIQLAQGASFEAALRAINLGCNGVTANPGHESFPTNVARTRRVVEMAHACGVAVEGELGGVPGAGRGNGAKQASEGTFTSVEEARAYVERTQVDSLAVSVGTALGRARGRLRPDFERLKRIHEAVNIPLVIQAGAGLSDEQVRRLTTQGVAKINCHAALTEAAYGVIRANARGNGAAGYAGLFAGARAVIAAEVERGQRLFGAAGRAAEVLAQCRSWQPVEHVILYNVEGANETQVEAMMARGREVLAKIPGVRRVLSGWAVADKPKFRFCWIVEFTHEKVITSYRNHPEHTAFANSLFRPMTGDRISIDFATTAGGPAVQPADAGPRMHRAAAGSMSDNR